jgi:hypothetical protein
VNVELNAVELRLMVQSLTHCIETCKHKGEAAAAACEDCDAARALLQRVRTLTDKAG